MELSLGIILDELAAYNPIIHKKVKNQEIKKIRRYDPFSIKTDNACLYIVDADLTEPYPKNLIVVGEAINTLCLKKADTVIQVSGGISVDGILQTCFDICEDFETWNQTMLLAIINHSPISNFLEIAAEKLVNPIALFDNSLGLMAKAGTFINSSKGTVWDKIGPFGLVLSDFYTIQEQRMFSDKNLNRHDMPYIFHPAADKGHTYA
ncbi:MAG: hypothetical protein LBG57_12385, partial [Treponema sp.]|nr:hypothetical protein [Treponema sp.]